MVWISVGLSLSSIAFAVWTIVSRRKAQRIAKEAHELRKRWVHKKDP